MNAKTRAVEIYNQHIGLASSDGRSFRKTVMDQLMQETGCTLAAAATHYNNAKKAAPVEGLGRTPVPKGARKLSNKSKPDSLQADEECFSVLELVPNGSDMEVGRCQAFLMQGDASECFDEKIEAWPTKQWVMINGLGPNSGDTFKLGAGEAIIKQYPVVSVKEAVQQSEEVAA
jgi:hypothetical protein